MLYWEKEEVNKKKLFILANLGKRLKTSSIIVVTEKQLPILTGFVS